MSKDTKEFIEQEMYKVFYDQINYIEDEIDKMIEPPENEYDKGWNRACKVILEHIGHLRYEIERSIEEDTFLEENEK